MSDVWEAGEERVEMCLCNERPPTCGPFHIAHGRVEPDGPRLVIVAVDRENRTITVGAANPAK